MTLLKGEKGKGEGTRFFTSFRMTGGGERERLEKNTGYRFSPVW
jgi:hypothetical protein